MEIFTLISLVSSIICFSLGNFIYYKNPREPLNRVFSVLSIVLACWTFAEFMVRQSASQETAYFWIKTTFYLPFIVPLLLHFALIFTDSPGLKAAWIYVLVYTPAVIVSFLRVFTDLMFTKPVLVYGYYNLYSGIPDPPYLYWANAVWFVSWGILSIILLTRYHFTGANEIKRKQARLIVTGYIICVIPFCIEIFILPFLNVNIPQLDALYIIIVMGFAGYAVWKYELFVFNPGTAAEGILSIMSDALVLCNTKGEIIRVNTAGLKMLGYGEKELAGYKLDELFVTDKQVDRGNGFLFNAINEQNYSLSARSRSGRLVPVIISSSPFKDKNGQVAGFIVNIKDVSELKQADEERERLRQQLMQSDKMAAVGQLAGGIAHEINNPLGVILGFAQIAGRNIKESDALHMPLKSIEREAVRCKKLVSDLLTFSRSYKSAIERISLNTAIDSALVLVKTRARTQNIEIISVFDGNIPEIMANSNQLQQVIINLCNNAIDAIPDGAASRRVTVKTSSFVAAEQSSAEDERALPQQSNFIEIFVSDTGTGMSEEVRKHLFEPFFTTKEVGKGTGLGLSLVYEIVKKHKGTIEVESEKDRGTVFKIKLPIE